MIKINNYISVEDIDKAMESLRKTASGYPKGSKVSLSYKHHYTLLKEAKKNILEKS